MVGLHIYTLHNYIIIGVSPMVKVIFNMAGEYQRL